MTTTAPPKDARGRVYVVLLNWNGWADTIRCLESCEGLAGVPFQLVACDNGSSDDSLARLKAWASARFAADWRFLGADAVAAPVAPSRLVLIENGANLGFAAGCNVGIRHALAQDDCAFVWVLNNDTTVVPGTLAALVDACRADPRIGICGSVVRFARPPHRIQSAGGRLDPRFCTTHLLHAGEHALAEDFDGSDVDFVPGASMLVTRAYLDTVGPMSPDYFLYFEEIDWAERGRGRFRFAIARDSEVFHVGGASIGSHTDASSKGRRAEWYLLRGRLLFARRFRRRNLPTVYAGMLASIARRLLHGEFASARVATAALFDRPIADLPHLALDRTPDRHDPAG